jgi:hypothetical protein
VNKQAPIGVEEIDTPKIWLFQLGSQLKCKELMMQIAVYWSARCLVGLVMVGMLCFAGTASAQEMERLPEPHASYGPSSSSTSSSSDSTMYGAALFGFSGEMTDAKNSSDSQDMATSFGGILGYEYSVASFFGIGLRGQFSAFQNELENEAEFSRNYAISLNVVPKLKYISRETGSEIYFALPVGPSYTKISSDVEEVVDAVGAEVDGGFDYHLSALLGLVMRSERGGPGLFVEGGMMRQGVKYEITFEFDDSSETSEEEASFTQFVLNTGLVFSL